MTSKPLIQSSLRMNRPRWAMVLLCGTIACSPLRQEQPVVSPEQIPPVAPAIQAHALLVITPAFEQYTSEGALGSVGQLRTQYGEAATRALGAMVTRSFATTEIRRLTEEEASALLAGPSDPTNTALLLVPSFVHASAGVNTRFVETQFDRHGQVKELGGATFDQSASLALLLTARTPRIGRPFTWVASSTADSVVTRRGAASLVLGRAIRALGDSMAAHRMELESTTPP